MKSRICLCNGTILKKDLTRFAPVVLLTALALWAVGAVMGNLKEYLWDGTYSETMDTAITTVGVAMATMLALVSGVCLFGYLTKKRECDHTHALPLRRETLFFTKIWVGFLQFVLPFGVFFVFFPGSRGWGFQMLAALSAWVFTFGLTVFCMMLSGRKLAGCILYYLAGITGSVAVSVLDTVYLPLLPGVILGPKAADLSMYTPLLGLDPVADGPGKLLLTLGLYALAGAALLGAALVLYRRRKLERAGDFLAAKWLEPVFAWGLGIYATVLPIAITTLIGGSIWIGLIIGLTVGYFGARMLFARSVKVFHKKNLAGFAALTAMMAASVFVTSMDPLGLVERVPEMDRIESISLCDSNGYYSQVYDLVADSGYTTADPAEIEELRQLHRNLIGQEQPEFLDALMEMDSQIYLEYKLKNGRTLRRTYYAMEGGDLKTVKYYLSQPEALVGTADIEELLGRIDGLYAYGIYGGTIHTQRAFLEVFLEECEAGWMYTPDYDEMSDWGINLEITGDDGITSYCSVDVPLTAQKTIAWLESYFADSEGIDDWGR